MQEDFMNLKKLIFPVLIIFSFVSCNQIEVHEHSFSDEWLYDEEKHWCVSLCCSGEYTTDGVVHDYEVYETPATCTESGSRRNECKICGYFYEEELECKGHSFLEEIKTLATCISPEITERICLNCGEIYEDETSGVASHAFGDWTEIPSNCLEDGLRTKKCLYCEKTISEVIPKETDNHDFCEWEIVPETCVSAGEKKRVCSVCAKSEMEELQPIGHLWDLGTEIKAASVLGEGEMTFTCSRCNEKRIEVIPAFPRQKLQEIGKYENLPDEVELVTFGVWPQTIKEDHVEIYSEVLNDEGFSADYFLGSDGSWYAELEENPVSAGGDSGASSRYHYSNGDKAQLIENGRKLFFKVEPIVWRKTGEENFLISEKALVGNIPYYEVQKSSRKDDEEKPVYSANYSESLIRAFLNGLPYGSENEVKDDYDGKGFLNGAFTKEMQKRIKCEKVRNDSLSTKDFAGTEPAADGTETYTVSSKLYHYPDFTSPNTEDLVFLLSFEEITSQNLGFQDFTVESSIRRKKPTDYAIANHVYVGEKGVNWFTRSPYYKVKEGNSGKVRYVHSTGKVSGTLYTNNMETGLVPAIKIIPTD